MEPPTYFEDIREESARYWATLDANPKIAGAIGLLFRQVQSPRHVLSELLQNAEDAGARSAHVGLIDGSFDFSHDGADFTRENFDSLCNFGYSDKKGLHTIGFRGLGFKSTFSLGDTVQLRTPTLSVAFHRNRFTEPVWTDLAGDDAMTSVRVRLTDVSREREISKNLDEWTTSPFSLLFFRTLRTLNVGGEVVRWEELGPGPVPRSEWLRLHGSEERLLVIRSEPMQFPEAALQEIREERGADQDFQLPACEVTLVLGAEGRLFVVLPTGVRPDLPFAVNAPFVQDPSRIEIKDPSVSPTNRWLLERAGQLAASAMAQWLENSNLTLIERAQAYDLLPPCPTAASDLGATCTELVYEAFLSAIADKGHILTESGELVLPQTAVLVPPALLNVWAATEVPGVLGIEEMSAVASAVTEPQRQKLLGSFHLRRVDRTNVAESLVIRTPPKPKSWRQLMALWLLLGPELAGHRWNAKRSQVRMLPVPGSGELHRAADLVRLGDKRLLNREDDWQFLSEYAIVLDQNWLRYLAAERKRAEERDDEATISDIDAAHELLAKVGLDDTSSPTDLFARFVQRFADEGSDSKISTWVRIAEMGAALGAAPPAIAMFVARNRQLKLAAGMVYDRDGSIGTDHPIDWTEASILHESYVRERESCTEVDWDRWVAAHFGQLPPLAQKAQYMRRATLEDELRTRGYGGPLQSRYSYPGFRLIDWDFDQQHWDHWHALAEADECIWERLVRRLLSSRRLRVEQRRCEAREEASNGNIRTLPLGSIPAAWIIKLHDLPCLRDSRGFLRKPSELLCRTPETDSLFGVVPFIETALDTEANRDLLVALGVGTRPNSTEHLLRRLRALSNAHEPPLLELAKLYEALDGVVRSSPADELADLRATFADEKLVFTRESGWTTAPNAFTHADESDAPEAPLVLTELKDLLLWSKLGVADRPTAEMALGWLSRLPLQAQMPPEDLRRARALQVRYPSRVWEECGRWLNLNGRLSLTADLRFSLTMQEMVSYTGLFPWVRDVTANLQALPVPVLSGAPFNGLPTLASCIDERLSQELAPSAELPQPWLATLADRLSRVILEDDKHQGAVRSIAQRMARTIVRSVEELQTVPHVSGVPAGTPREVPALWTDDHLYVLNLPAAQLVKPLSDVLAQPFQPYGFADAIRLCYQRDGAFIKDYLDANFQFEPAPANDQVDDPRSSVEPYASVTPPSRAAGSTPLEDANFSTDHPRSAIDDEPSVPLAATADDSWSLEPIADDVDSAETEVRPPRRRPAPRTPGLIERFATGLGFAKRDEGLFEGPAGEILSRERGELFPWQLHADGQPVRYYWLKETDIDREPVLVPAPVWHLLQERPADHHFVLDGADGAVSVFDGATLVGLVNSQDLGLFAAEYRLTKRATE